VFEIFLKIILYCDQVIENKENPHLIRFKCGQTK